MGITLTRKERRELERTVRRATAAQRDVQRAKIALLVAEGWGNAAIARALGCAENTVRRWRRRFAERRREGLEDRPRSGRPRTYDDRARTVVKGIACELPATRGLPLSRLSLADLHGEVRRELRPCPSRSTIGRWLREDAIKPWQHRMWVTPRAPDFYVKASRVLDLYHARWRGKPLAEGDVVLCGDEKTCLQVLRRAVPTRPPAPGCPARVEHEYTRHGVLVYGRPAAIRDLDVDHLRRAVPVSSACRLYASTIRCTSLCRTTSSFPNSTNAIASIPARMSRTWMRPDACSRGRSI